MDRDPRGTISQQGNVMRIDNAFVEEVVPANRSSNGYLLVSYATAGANRTTSIQNLRLNITRNTVLLDSLGRQIRLSDIRKGMWVNVVFSSAMTRSIPPQSTAFLIVARRDFQTSSSTTTTGRVAMSTRSMRFSIPATLLMSTVRQNIFSQMPRSQTAPADRSASGHYSRDNGSGSHMQISRLRVFHRRQQLFMFNCFDTSSYFV